MRVRVRVRVRVRGRVRGRVRVRVRVRVVCVHRCVRVQVLHGMCACARVCDLAKDLLELILGDRVLANLGELQHTAPSRHHSSVFKMKRSSADHQISDMQDF